MCILWAFSGIEETEDSQPEGVEDEERTEFDDAVDVRVDVSSTKINAVMTELEIRSGPLLPQQLLSLSFFMNK